MTQEKDQDIENLYRILNGNGKPGLVGRILIVENWMASSTAWRTAIIGIIVTIFLQVVTFAYLYGRLTATVDNGIEAAKDIKQEIARLQGKVENRKR